MKQHAHAELVYKINMEYGVYTNSGFVSLPTILSDLQNNNLKRWQLRCVATWRSSTSRQLFWTLITKSIMQQPIKL